MEAIRQTFKQSLRRLQSRFDRAGAGYEDLYMLVWCDPDHPFVLPDGFERAHGWASMSAFPTVFPTVFWSFAFYVPSIEGPERVQAGMRVFETLESEASCLCKSVWGEVAPLLPSDVASPKTTVHGFWARLLFRLGCDCRRGSALGARPMIRVNLGEAFRMPPLPAAWWRRPEGFVATLRPDPFAASVLAIDILLDKLEIPADEAPAAEPVAGEPEAPLAAGDEGSTEDPGDWLAAGEAREILKDSEGALVFDTHPKLVAFLADHPEFPNRRPLTKKGALNLQRLEVRVGPLIKAWAASSGDTAEEGAKLFGRYQEAFLRKEAGK